MPRMRLMNADRIEIRGRPCHASVMMAPYITIVQARNTAKVALGARSQRALRVRPHSPSNTAWKSMCNAPSIGVGISGKSVDRGVGATRPLVLIMSKAVVAGVAGSCSFRFNGLSA